MVKAAGNIKASQVNSEEWECIKSHLSFNCRDMLQGLTGEAEDQTSSFLFLHTQSNCVTFIFVPT